ncbi:MAG: CRISPR-associated ring nuclease, partial [Armatimonadota bacterium]|nr:CRISPR-associated ring nuclease [Armatimonadota bacterium]
MATLGHEPQVVTITLDLLLADRRPVRQLTVVHTSSEAVLAGLRSIREEVASGRYEGVRLR